MSDRAMEPVRFLIVDDDEVTVMSLKRAIRKLNLANDVSVARDGIEALDFLRGQGSASSALLPPYLILLDINMPRMDGHEFLAEIRGDDALKRSVVFVLTTSDTKEDIDRAYEKNVAGYVVKEDPYSTLRDTLAMVHQYQQLVVLPA